MRLLLAIASLCCVAPAFAGYDFEASESDYMRVSAAVLTSGDTSMTMACWFKLETTGALQTLLSLTDPAASSLGADNTELQINASNAVVARLETGAATAGTVSTGTWYLATAVYEASNSRYAYLNTTKSAQNTTDRTAGWNSLTIGANGYASQSSYFDGILGECAVWNVALSDSDVSSLYNSGSGVAMDTVGTPVWYRKLRTDLTTPATGTSPTNNGATQVGDDPFSAGGSSAVSVISQVNF
jgi:hypothetical protein